MDGEDRNLWGFAFTLGHSRMMMAEVALNQKLGTLLRMHEEAFRQMGGVPEEILYDYVAGDIIVRHDLRHPAQKLEGAHVGSDPVGQSLRQARLGIGVVTG